MKEVNMNKEPERSAGLTNKIPKSPTGKFIWEQNSTMSKP
jgi:hypothetical protein